MASYLQVIDMGVSKDVALCQLIDDYVWVKKAPPWGGVRLELRGLGGKVNPYL